MCTWLWQLKSTLNDIILLKGTIFQYNIAYLYLYIKNDTNFDAHLKSKASLGYARISFMTKVI